MSLFYAKIFHFLSAHLKFNFSIINGVHGFEGGIAADLLRLMKSTEISEKKPILSIRRGREIRGLDTAAKISAAYNNNLCSLFSPLTPLLPVCALTDTARTFKKVMNNKELKEYTCWVPRVRCFWLARRQLTDLTNWVAPGLYKTFHKAGILWTLDQITKLLESLHKLWLWTLISWLDQRSTLCVWRQMNLWMLKLFYTVKMLNNFIINDVTLSNNGLYPFSSLMIKAWAECINSVFLFLASKVRSIITHHWSMHQMALQTALTEAVGGLHVRDNVQQWGRAVNITHNGGFFAG